MEIQISETPKGLPLVRVVGEIDLHTCPELRGALQALIESGKYRIVLDLGGVPYVDSAALGVLVDTQRRVEGEGRRGVFIAHHVLRPACL